jgi:hypothetical protein
MSNVWLIDVFRLLNAVFLVAYTGLYSVTLGDEYEIIYLLVVYLTTAVSSSN